MPEQPELAQLPNGLHWHMLGKQLILTCAHCGRRWRGDKYGDPRNQTFLREHLAEHQVPLKLDPNGLVHSDNIA